MADSTPETARTVDLIVHGGGTIYLLRPTSPTGAVWIEECIQPNAQWFGGGIVVEHRYIRDIILGAISDGLKVRR